MKSVVRQALTLGAAAALGFGVFVALFAIGALASIEILFYRGTALAVVSAVIVALAAIPVCRRTGDASVPMAAAAVTLSLNLCFLVLLPVTVDRSVTVYLLATVDQAAPGSVRDRDLERAFIDNYVVGMGAIDRRIFEQRRSGNLALTADGRVRLTDQGRRFMALSRLVSRVFGADPRFVTGSATIPPSSSAPRTGALR